MGRVVREKGGGRAGLKRSDSVQPPTSTPFRPLFRLSALGRAMSRHAGSQTHYQVLDVDPKATPDEIRRSWRSLVLLVRTIRHCSPERARSSADDPRALPGRSTIRTRAHLRLPMAVRSARSASSRSTGHGPSSGSLR
jgi:hypothetical protein